MTKETFEYTIETCDICKRKVKNNPKIKEQQPLLAYTSYNITSATTWVCHDYKPEPVPEHIDMCESCTESFKKWRANREHRCGCADY
jgi:hypothetical protein